MTKLKFLILPTQSTLAIYYFLLSHLNIPPYIFLLLLSSPLLLRISPNTFAFIPIPLMSLSSRNRSNSKDFYHILPCVAPVYEDMHYHKTGVPWQIKSIFIMFLYLHLSLVFLLKHLIFQGFPTFEFSFLFKVFSQIFSCFLTFFPAILVSPLVKQASLPTGFLTICYPI